LARAAHDVVVVCGDAHFGRVATIDVSGTGRRHVEVISSPLTVLDGAEAPVSCGLDDGLDVFPPGTGAGQQVGVAKQVNAVPGRHDGAICEDHAMLLGFTSGHDGGVVCTVGAYLMRHADRHGNPELAWTERFDLR
jgi:hypothetical protein